MIRDRLRAFRVETPPDLETGLVLVAAVLLPWAFGGVEIWAYRSAALLLALAAAIALVREGWHGLGLDRDARWLLPALLLAVLAALQILPLPPSVVRVLSPAADRIYRENFPGYPGRPPADLLGAIEEDALARVPEARDVPTPPGDLGAFRPELRGRWSGWRPLSIHPLATVERLFWYVALLLAFLVTLGRARSRGSAGTGRTVLFGLFAGLAAFGLVQAATWNGKMYWMRQVERIHPFGPYVAPTHFAGVMELGIPWMVAVALSRFRLAKRDALRDPVALLACGGAAICAASLFLAASKTAALLVGLSLTALLLVGARGVRNRIIAATGAGAAWIAGAAFARITPLGTRVAELVDTAAGDLTALDRVVAWRAGLEVLRDFPWTGTGFGTFRQIFPRYLPGGESGIWNQLHNDVLEVALDGGLVAAILMAWLAWGFWRRVVRRVREARAGEEGLPRVGLVLGIASLTAHAFVDFNHQIPANALLYVVACALALAPPGARPEEAA